MSDGCGAIQAAEEFMNLADQRVEVVGYERPEAGHGGGAAVSGSSAFVATMRRVRPYALAVVFVAIAVGLGVVAWLLGWDKLAFPLILMGIAAAVWYGGPGPGVLAIALGSLCFNYFFTVPQYTFEIDPSDRPYFVAFVLFAFLIGWFASRRRRVELELRVARDQLAVEVVKRTEQASLLDLTHDTILVRGMDDVISYWNHGAQELFGWTSEQAIGKSAHELLHTVFPMPLGQIHAELVRTGRWEGELAKTKADGTQVVVSARWSLRRDEQGHPVAILATNNDITERKRRDERIRQLNADLERRSRDLEASNKELEAFAYSTSHDLRAPLRHMAGYSELLQKHAAPVLDEKARRYVTMLLESAKKMGDLIDDLLAFSRIGRAEARNTLVSMDQLVAEAVNEVQREAPERSIAWKIGALPSLQGDRAMLRLVLVNLVSNAVKFTRTRAQAEIEVGCIDGQPDEVVVFVKDNGVGFDMKYANKLFGVFQRLHRAEAFEGTGIGLATVQRIVARHGGRVWAEGVEDGGATFYFSAAKTTGDRI
jgi:PAS domain S-box-containing protein